MNDTKRTSLADVVMKILSDWRTFVRALVALVAFGAVLGLTVYGIVALFGRFLGVEPTRITLSAFGSGVILESRGAPEDGDVYLVMVHPHGWQETEIQVAAGDSVYFAASGTTHISLNSIVQSTEVRHEIERKYIGAGRVDLNIGEVPEDLFTPEENDRVALPRPWLGPEGHVSGDIVDHAIPGRTAMKVMSGRPYGELIGAISTNAEAPGMEERFAIGRLASYQAQNPGRLWFVVNDVLFGDDRFFNDNLGMLLVRVTLKRK